MVNSNTTTMALLRICVFNYSCHINHGWGIRWTHGSMWKDVILKCMTATAVACSPLLNKHEETQATGHNDLCASWSMDCYGNKKNVCLSCQVIIIKWPNVVQIIVHLFPIILHTLFTVAYDDNKELFLHIIKRYCYANLTQIQMASRIQQKV